MSKLSKTIALTLSLAAMSAAPSFAKQTAPDNMQPSDQVAAEQQRFDDSTLQKFTVAMSAVQSVAEKYQAQIQQEKSPEKLQALQSSAQQEMVAEIKDAGMKVNTYTTIAQLARSNEALRQRIMSIVNEQENS